MAHTHAIHAPPQTPAASPTHQLVNWAHAHTLASTPASIVDRAKMILLDGLGCALFGSHLPWSAAAVSAILEIESGSTCSLIGWPDVTLSPAGAALLNSTFIQGFGLDDWHAHAPLHSAALLIPSLFAAAEHVAQRDGVTFSGAQFLLAFTVGLEAGPRIGLGMGGAEMLHRGWHSGAVFGGPAAALAVSKLLELSPRQMEWALGHACTQAGGLMSSQFESMAKRMQHGFAARNGTVSAFLARSGYTGIERVLERDYGGFWPTFSPSHGGKLGQTDERVSVTSKNASVFDSLGDSWEIGNILIKPYPLMAALHAPVNCIERLQEKHMGILEDTGAIASVELEMGIGSYKKGGWCLDRDFVQPLSAQMNAACAVAIQLLDMEVCPASFTMQNLNRQTLKALIGRISCIHRPEFDGSLRTRATIRFTDSGTPICEEVDLPKGVAPRLGNSEVVEKCESVLKGVVDVTKMHRIRGMVMAIQDVHDLEQLLSELRIGTGAIIQD